MGLRDVQAQDEDGIEVVAVVIVASILNVETGEQPRQQSTMTYQPSLRCQIHPSRLGSRRT